ncbi:DivIVA domain-containing protein [Dactylosporangium sp. AC04546]|uniref:DivIVA domain-containing protein n=1 Tax=Dactylosporangium sp. AC04546 TaxID=2862460 RepID=UPI001EDD7F11|nr:DivIVA domain-containing protein [Dactylosporangium sp. AC04546]WVK88474.1 DivIVA domain-containing protein [Dactylosporangium sp. AC04546]
MVEFEVVLRGYDRHEVDTLVRAIEAGADPQRLGSNLTVVLRGYDRQQVDGWIARRRGGASPRRAEPPLELSVVLRGYRPAETDALITEVRAALAGDDPARRAAAARAIAETRLPVGLRGYDRGAVNAFLRRAAQELAAG